MIKGKLIIVLFFVTLTLGLFWYLSSGSSVSIQMQARPCNAPVTYRLGDIDSRFNINRRTVRNVMSDVESMWADAGREDLVSYSDTGNIAINFIYSEEQQFTESEQQLSQRIDRLQQEFNKLQQNYTLLSSQYKEQVNQYQRELSQFNSIVDDYNDRVSELNRSGGVAKGQEQQLNAWKQQIDQLKSTLIQKQRKLDNQRREVNRISSQLNALSNQQNILVSHYNDRYGNRKEFDQGNYTRYGNEENINIYQFDNIDNLRLVLAHEVGHALGLGHVENPTSVMYYLMEQQDTSNPRLTEEDIAALQQICTE